jgi:hypothetical protein
MMHECKVTVTHHSKSGPTVLVEKIFNAVKSKSTEDLPVNNSNLTT